MAEAKKYYWIKLKDSFMTSDAVDFLMGQKNGAEYVVLYQMLCLKTVNTKGKLERQIGEVLIPYDAAKIQRDCKYFGFDTVVTALNLYQKLGLVYQEESGTLQIANYDNLVGGETAQAAIMRKTRQKKALGGNNVTKSGNNVTKLLPEQLPKCYPDVTQEKEIRYRDKILDISSSSSSYSEEDCQEEEEEDLKNNSDSELAFYIDCFKNKIKQQNDSQDLQRFADWILSKPKHKINNLEMPLVEVIKGLLPITPKQFYEERDKVCGHNIARKDTYLLTCLYNRTASGV